jgi:hypothetical protein
MPSHGHLTWPEPTRLTSPCRGAPCGPGSATAGHVPHRGRDAVAGPRYDSGQRPGGPRVAPLVGASRGLRGDDCQDHRRQACEFGPENALNDADPRYVIKLESERKLNCRQQAQDPSRGIQISRRLNHGKATTASGSVPEMRCRGRTHHRSVRIAADSVSALRRLRPHVGDARVGVVGLLTRMPGQRSSPSGGGSTIGRCAAFRSLSSSWRLRPVGRRGLPSHFTVTGLSAP